MTAPRTISAEMIQAARKAMGEVWEQHEPEVPEELRVEWKRLCKRHCANWFSLKWAK